MKTKVKIILFLAFILRLIFVPLVSHNDVYDQLNWAKDLERNGLVGFYDRDIPDAGDPNYPPLYFLTIYANNSVYLFTRNVLWSANTKIKIFPSQYYLWFENDHGRIAFNKLLPIFCDLGIGYLIYQPKPETGEPVETERAVLDQKNCAYAIEGGDDVAALNSGGRCPRPWRLI